MSYTVADQSRHVQLKEIVGAAEFIAKINQGIIDSGKLSHEEKIAAAAVATSFEWFVLFLKGIAPDLTDFPK